MAAMIELVNLERSFKVGKAIVRAVDGVNLSVNDGEVVCVVGESGCGKTTTGKMAVGLLRPTGGEVRYRGKDIWHMTPDEARKYRQAVQIIHQDPYSSLNPTQTVGDILVRAADASQYRAQPVRGPRTGRRHPAHGGPDAAGRPAGQVSAPTQRRPAATRVRGRAR